MSINSKTEDKTIKNPLLIPNNLDTSLLFEVKKAINWPIMKPTMAPIIILFIIISPKQKTATTAEKQRDRPKNQN